MKVLFLIFSLGLSLAHGLTWADYDIARNLILAECEADRTVKPNFVRLGKADHF